MNTEQRAAHWAEVYQKKRPDEVSWYQPRPDLSMRLIQAAGTAAHAPIVDIGGGASTLVDALIAAGYANISVMDISLDSLDLAKTRLGPLAAKVSWIAADVLDFKANQPVALWHDRAVFHFLTNQRDRDRYVDSLKRNLAPDAAVVIATFATDGPEKCSGLPVERYDTEKLAAVLGTDFQVVERAAEIHSTPWGSEQAFQYSLFKYTPSPAL